MTSTTSQAAFDDPVTGTTRVSLCLYGTGGTLIQGLAVSEAGQTCVGKPCWKAAGTKGLKDKAALADGVTHIKYGSGDPGKGKASAAGKNDVAKGLAALPTGIVAGLSGNTNPTLQVVTSDGLCLGATMTVVAKDDGFVFQAQKK